MVGGFYGGFSVQVSGFIGPESLLDRELLFALTLCGIFPTLAWITQHILPLLLNIDRELQMAQLA
jgi:hypothetical protein